VNQGSANAGGLLFHSLWAVVVGMLRLVGLSPLRLAIGFGTFVTLALLIALYRNLTGQSSWDLEEQNFDTRD